MNRKYIIILMLLVVFPLMGWQIFSYSSYWNDPVDQWKTVTTFSHKFHIEDVEAECTDCHVRVEESTVSSDFLVPMMDECGECHDVEDEDECATCHGEDGEPEDTFAQPTRELSFNHKIHVESEIECTTCHVGIEASEAPSNSFFPKMTVCQTCHDGAQQHNTCETCHTQLALLRPQNHRWPDWKRQHKRFVVSGQHEKDCASCHAEAFCQECHSAAQIVTTVEPIQRPLLEARQLQFSRTLLTSQRIHENNYVFWHAIDHKAKTMECATCHNKQTFCNDCHNQQQDAGFASPIPASHSQLGFVQLGVGGGGGEHAKLAKKDIEACMSCHDLNGQDPACLLCHNDRTPGLGNDPKTHEAKFMHDAEGNYHDNPDASCYNCHIDTGQAGVGFCGYCHGAK